MKLPIKLIPQEIIDQYNLTPLVHNGYIYICIDKCMYGLPQAGCIAWDLLKERLAKHGYRPTKHTPGLWKHDTQPIWFCLCVDGFGVKYTNKEDAQHLVDTLQQYYAISLDWDGTLYCGMTLKWSYKDCYIDIYAQVYQECAGHTQPSPPKATHS